VVILAVTPWQHVWRTCVRAGTLARSWSVDTVSGTRSAGNRLFVGTVGFSELSASPGVNP
jgi:hypothetical protein